MINIKGKGGDIMDKKQNENKEVNFEQIDVEKLVELVEVVTPGAGSIGCCTN